MSDALRTAVLIVIAALVGSVVGILVFIQVTGGSGTPSGETVAPTLDPDAIPTLSASQSFALATRAAELEDTVAAQAAAIAALETAATEIAIALPEATAIQEATALTRRPPSRLPKRSASASCTASPPVALRKRAFTCRKICAASAPTSSAAPTRSPAIS